MSSKVRVAVLDDYPGAVTTLADWSYLNGKADVTVFRDHADGPELVERLKPFEVVCLTQGRTSLPRPVLEQLPNLKMIATTGRRNANVDLEYLKQKGIVMCGTGGGDRFATAELTWALILALCRRIPEETASVRNGGWQAYAGPGLEGKTLGIVGLGNLGSQVAKVGQAFGMKVIAWSQNLTKETAEQKGATSVTKDQLFQDSDVVTIHYVLSPRSRGLITAKELGMMKPTAYLINTSRGPIVDEKALVDVLTNRKIAGAGLDVFDIEPLPKGHPLRTLSNVLATSHIGYGTSGTFRVWYRDMAEDVSAWIDGNPVRVAEL